MTDQEFDERLAEFWGENELPAGEQAVDLLLGAAFRIWMRLEDIKRNEALT